MVQVQWSAGRGADRMKVAKLRAACIKHQFDLVRLPTKGVFQLIDLGIGHAVINAGRGTTAFNVREALAYFRARDRDVEAGQANPSGVWQP